MPSILKIRAERQRRGWSQQQLGCLAGVQATDVSRIENGRFIPYPNQLRRLAEVLEIETDELLQPVEA
jgi:transcriptional regulator with XRE-family HTH domain